MFNCGSSDFDGALVYVCCFGSKFSNILCIAQNLFLGEKFAKKCLHKGNSQANYEQEKENMFLAIDFMLKLTIYTLCSLIWSLSISSRCSLQQSLHFTNITFSFFFSK